MTLLQCLHDVAPFVGHNLIRLCPVPSCQGVVPERQAGFDFVPFDFAATRRDVDAAMANFALQVPCRAVPI